MKTLTALAIAALIIAFSANGVKADAPNPNCLPTGPDDPTCIWQLELTKVEVAVEYEYPHCEVKLTVEHNSDELPDGVSHVVSSRTDLGTKTRSGGYRPTFHTHVSPVLLFNPPGGDYYWQRNGYENNMERAHTANTQNNSGMGYYNSGMGFYVWLGDGQVALSTSDFQTRFDHTNAQTAASVARRFASWQNRTLGDFHLRAVVEYDWESEFASEFARERRVGNNFVHYKGKLPLTFVSDSIPISHTFAGLTEEVFACFEVAKREHARAEERAALDTEKAGLRATLKLLEAELVRARRHELDATTVLKEVVAIATRIEEVLRTIHRLRVEGVAERRQLIERYYSEEAQRYSVFIKSLEASEAALAASDKAIAAHKAEIEASREKLNDMVEEAQAAEAALIAEIENARESLGTD